MSGYNQSKKFKESEVEDGIFEDFDMYQYLQHNNKIMGEKPINEEQFENFHVENHKNQ